MIPRHRIFAFDKRTGEKLWFATPGGTLADKNSQSTPALAVIGGRRLLIHGNGDGAIYAVNAHTGEKVWSYQLSKRGINTSVVVEGDTVYASHGEDNVDTGDMGRLVAIDATGSGNVSATHERWRADVGAGFSSPLLAAGRIYAIDNSANLHALDPATGEELWSHNLGRVGKGSPVFADGRIYATEVNGRFIIVQPGDEGAETLSASDIKVDGRRAAEIYGSPAIAYGRIYFTTEEGLYCLGDKDAPFEIAASEMRELDEPAAEGEAASLLVAPAEVVLAAGATADFRALAFDGLGRPLGEVEADWSLDGLEGEISADGGYSAGADNGSRSGRLVASVGEMSATARVRVFDPMPMSEDFEGVEAGSRPSYMVGYLPRFAVEEQEGNRVLAKGPSPAKIHRHITFLGPSDWSDYTIMADLKATRDGRKIGDVGVINSGYTMELMGGHQRLQIRSWPSALRMMHQIDFEWEPDVWYRMKLAVHDENGQAVIRGKVWKTDAEEPSDWSITTQDPLPIEQGSPGLAGYSPAPVYYDNVEVTSNR
jgi:outer membrane protein assembly factor BamB